MYPLSFTQDFKDRFDIIMTQLCGNKMIKVYNAK